MCIYAILKKTVIHKIQKKTQVKRSYLNDKEFISENIAIDS